MEADDNKSGHEITQSELYYVLKIEKVGGMRRQPFKFEEGRRAQFLRKNKIDHENKKPIYP